ncbi:MAG: V-type ATP synthase subunit A, partial [Oscillospiraceae bacterium]
ASRLAQFYERAGRVICNGTEGREGELSAIGAVSPPGGDISEPVSQATLRIVKVYWGLDSALAYARHFPAINWLSSYSLYLDRLGPWYGEHIGPNFMAQRHAAMQLLQQESELNEIVKLVGIDALSAADRLVMETTRMLREDFLQQNAMSDTDSYCSLDKQCKLLELILTYHDLAKRALAAGAPMKQVFSISARDRIGRAKDVPQNSYPEVFADIEREIKAQLEAAQEVSSND